jgi:adenine deaminase
MATESAQLPDDLSLNAADEVKTRQDLVLVALGKSPADRIVRVARLLDVATRRWLDDQGSPHRVDWPNGCVEG